MSRDIITFGSATLDIFLRGGEFLVKPIKDFTVGKGVCFPLGAKVDIEKMDFRTGGGGTNTAATFSLQGLKTAFCGKIGKDFASEEVIKDLRRLNITRSFTFRTKEKPTNISLIFSFKKERNCFVWRGASELLKKEDIPWERMKTDWFYLAPLSGKLASLFKPLVNFAHKKGIKVFLNPGNTQIRQGARKLSPFLGKVDILLLNQEEASLLTGVAYGKEKKLFKKLDKLVPGIAIMTKGSEGAIVSDGNYLWQAKSLYGPAVEKTGAGDAFGSGFLSGFIKKGDISFALQLGIANAGSCIKKLGAKEGLLKKNQPWKKVKVVKRKL